MDFDIISTDGENIKLIMPFISGETKENKLNFKKLQMQYMSWLGHASHSNSYNLVRSLIQKGNFF